VPAEIGAGRVLEMARSEYSGPIDIAGPQLTIEL
jgi:hypothetical protein